jgi:hypothetical protein
VCILETLINIRRLGQTEHKPGDITAHQKEIGAFGRAEILSKEDNTPNGAHQREGLQRHQTFSQNLQTRVPQRKHLAHSIAKQESLDIRLSAEARHEK